MTKTRTTTKAMTLVEMVVALAIFAIIFSAMIPQLRGVENSWAAKQSGTEVNANGRVFIDHITKSLNSAQQVTLVSGADNKSGYIQFLNSDANEMRYEISNSAMKFGYAGSTLSELARMAVELSFTCYDGYNLDTAITDVNSIRTVKIQAKFTDVQSGMTQSYSGESYIRTNALPPIGSKSSRYYFDISDGRGPALANIDGTHFLCAYYGWYSEGLARVLTVDSITNLITPSAATEFDYYIGLYPALAKIDSTRYLCAYEGSGDDGWSVILIVNPVSWAITKGTPFEFAPYSGDSVSLAQIDSTRFLCVYRDSAYNGYAVILNVNTTNNTISKGTAYKFESNRCFNPAIIKVDGTRFLCAYRGEADDGWSAVLTANVTTGTVIKNASFEFDTVKCDYPGLAQIDTGNYLCTYTGPDDHGWAVILKLNTATNAITKGINYEFDTKMGRYPALKKAGTNAFLCAYQSSNSKGLAQILNVSTVTGKTWKLASITFDGTRCYWPALAQVTEEKFVCAYQGIYDRGIAVVLNTDMQILP